MSAAPWPCSTCGSPGVRNLGTQGYCTAHLAEFYNRIGPDIWLTIGGGIGLPVSVIADSGEADLECVACSATWTGAVFMRCPWCAASIARLNEWQAEVVLQPPDVDLSDPNRRKVIEAWCDRLVVAVRSGLITRQQAEQAVRRMEARRAA